ncbi:alpha/beta fold hydrolase [Pseudonocardia nantongensis]|uniref:alpha/beta fold hydrolase n=1 Tax=Pseudonocardia nantongensis TaxID=1181885 RepID=UPI00397AE1FF
MDLLPGVRAREVSTDRIRMHLLEAGPDDGIPLVLVHGNLSTGRFYEHLMPGLAEAGYRVLAPDMRSFGRSDPAPLDATRGLDDWADDLAALLRALGITAAPHLAGWSTGGGAIARYALVHPAASLTLIDPVGPYGYGGVHPDGTLVHADGAGSGAAGANPDFVQRLRDGDRSADSPFSIRNVMRQTYWSPSYRLSPEREDVLVDEILLTVLGDGGYPGSAASSQHWPGFAPGEAGLLNAISPKHLRWDGVVGLASKPPVLWTHGTADLIVADGSMLEAGTLGQAGLIPGWPGEDAFPPQQMVTQIRDVLDRYAAAGGRVRTEMFDGSGHGPLFDAEARWVTVFRDFLDSTR